MYWTYIHVGIYVSLCCNNRNMHWLLQLLTLLHKSSHCIQSFQCCPSYETKLKSLTNFNFVFSTIREPNSLQLELSYTLNYIQSTLNQNHESNTGNFYSLKLHSREQNKYFVWFHMAQNIHFIISKIHNKLVAIFLYKHGQWDVQQASANLVSVVGQEL